MKKSKFSEAQIVSILKQGDAGIPVKDLCRQAGISTATYYQWKSKYGGMEASDLRRVRDLEAENAKLKRMYAELALDNAAMKDLIDAPPLLSSATIWSPIPNEKEIGREEALFRGTDHRLPA